MNKADAEAITATLPNGKRESLVWSELGPKAMSKILPLVVHREDAGDWLAAGLLGLAGQDAPSAERYFDKARSLGSGNRSLYGPAGDEDLAAVRNLLDKHRYAESESLLITLQEKYGKLPWFTANKSEWDAAAKEAKRGLREKDAEALYAQAAGLFHKGDLYELKPVVERFRAQYADSDVAADAQRKPPLAELEKAVADLGPLLRVRRDGKGDAKTVQEAVNKAAANATIQIEEAGSWSEQIVIPAEKGRLTICGKKGLLPVITSAGAKQLRRSAPGPCAAVVVGKAGDRACRIGGTGRGGHHRGNDLAYRARGGRARARPCEGTRFAAERLGGRRPCPARRLRQGLRLFRAGRFRGVLLAAECPGLRPRLRWQLRPRFTLAPLYDHWGTSTDRHVEHGVRQYRSFD